MSSFDEFVRPTALDVVGEYLAENANPAMLSDLLEAYNSPTLPVGAGSELRRALERILGYPGLEKAEIIEAIEQRIARDEVSKA